MANRAGVEISAQAGVEGDDVVFPRVVEAIGREGAILGGAWIGQHVCLFAVAGASADPDGDIAGQVILSAHDAEQLLFVRVGPVLREVGIGVRFRGHTGQRCHLWAWRVNAVVLIAKISGEAETLTSIVRAQRDDRQGAVLTVYSGLAITQHTIEAHAPGIVRAEPVAEVERAVKLAVAFDADRGAADAALRGALGHQVDGAADAAATRGCAVDEGVGTAEHFHAFQQFSRHELARQDAIGAVQGDVVGIDREAAQDVDFLEVAEALGDAHDRVILQDIADTVGLLGGDQVSCVGRAGEGRVEEIQITEHAGAAAAGHLATGIRVGQGDLRGIRHDYRLEHARIFGAGSVRSGVGCRRLGKREGGRGAKRQGGGGEDPDGGHGTGLDCERFSVAALSGI